MKLAGVVVTYNRKKELKKNLKAILEQTVLVDKYFIIDNHSSDNTYEELLQEGFLNNNIIEYIYLEENIGGAGGFYTGVKIAYEQGYDFICLMDDDGRPANNNTIEELLNSAQKLYKNNHKLMINSLVVGDDKETLSFSLGKKIRTVTSANKMKDKNNLIFNVINPFNGTLISKELIEEIGFPNKELFIKGDERDYNYRAKDAGAIIATVLTSKYFHPIPDLHEIKIFGKTFFGATETPWKEFYKARNITYIAKKRKKRYKKNILKQILLAIMFNNKKMETIKMIVKGYNQGKKGILGINRG